MSTTPFPPCATSACGHDRDDHSPIAGCLADDCECDHYVMPQDATVAALRDHGLEGRRLRDEGAALAGAGVPGVLASDWRRKASEAMAALIATGREFDADDLVERAGMPPVANMVGGVFIGASRAKRIRAVGYSTATRPESHARVQRTWVGA